VKYHIVHAKTYPDLEREINSCHERDGWEAISMCVDSYGFYALMAKPVHHFLVQNTNIDKEWSKITMPYEVGNTEN